MTPMLEQLVEESQTYLRVASAAMVGNTNPSMVSKNGKPSGRHLDCILLLLCVVVEGGTVVAIDGNKNERSNLMASGHRSSSKAVKICFKINRRQFYVSVASS
jgi:hypothetical protein